jgi:sodium/bile acid cotransporter 7
MKKYRPDWFISGLFLMLAAAWAKPGIAMDWDPVNLGLIIDIGIVLIFFFYGLKLDPAALKAGMRNWRMHTAIHLTTFLVFPLLILPFYPLVRGTDLEIFWMGLFFLAALPSTVSSSVVMVSVAGGNIPGAIFNASMSGIIGIVMTPFWMGLFLTNQNSGFNFSHVLLQLIVQIILPVVAGLFLRSFVVRWTVRHLIQLATFDKIIILLIVYQSFSHSFSTNVFSEVNWLVLSGLFLVSILLFFVIMGVTRFLAQRMHFSLPDRITLQFVGSQKSLMHASVFAGILFGGIGGAGVWLLPVMIYHSFQLFFTSLIARRQQNT